VQRKQQRRSAHAGRKAVAAYAADLAYIHDAGFRDYALGAAPWLIRTFRRHKIHRGLVVDLGCGSGRLADQLNRAGYDCLGVDQSAAMLKLARRVAPGTRFRKGSIFDMVVPQCSAIVATGEILNYRFSGAHTSPTGLRRLFRRVHAALTLGGVFIFDIATLERAPQNGPRIHWREGKDWSIYASTTSLARDGVIRSITAFRKVRGLYRQSTEIHHLRLYRVEDVARDLKDCGFQVAVSGSFGRSRIPEGMAVITAAKTLRR